jgi:hypothetical protein
MIIFQVVPKIFAGLLCYLKPEGFAPIAYAVLLMSDDEKKQPLRDKAGTLDTVEAPSTQPSSLDTLTNDLPPPCRVDKTPEGPFIFGGPKKVATHSRRGTIPTSHFLLAEFPYFTRRENYSARVQF